jgi:uncharacterized protein
MHFFTWGINQADIKEKRALITEDHWKFWDAYDDRMIARGPVLDPEDPSTVLGSIHIVELDSWEDTRPILTDEPYSKAGLFKEFILTRFSLGLDRTQFATDRKSDCLEFFIHCPAKEGMGVTQAELKDEHEAYCRSRDDIFVCRGELLTKAGDWDGNVFLVQFPTEADATQFLKEEPYFKAGLYLQSNIHCWRRGGRTK